MQAWEILGTEPTDDVMAIKQVYDRQVKACGSKDCGSTTDQQVIDQYHQAYVDILDALRIKHLAIAAQSSDTVEQSSGIGADWKPAEDIVAEFCRLLRQPQPLDSPEHQLREWLFFLAQPTFASATIKNEVSLDIFGQLIHFYHQNDEINLVTEVKSRLLDTFEWEQQSSELNRYYDQEAVTEVLTVLGQQPQPTSIQTKTITVESTDIEIDPIVYKMLIGIVLLLMGFVLLVI